MLYVCSTGLVTNMGEIRAIILGCGSSGGVPRIGNDWGRCDPDNPKNRRTRCSLFVEATDGNETTTRLLIDTAPDLREQLLANGIDQIDAVLFTHTHADQCHGIDDVRVLAYRNRKRMPVYASKESFAELRKRFDYCFETPEGSAYPPILEAQNPIREGVPFDVSTTSDSRVSVLPIDQDHGSVRSLGFRIGDLAYCNDVVDLPEQSLSMLTGLDVLIVDALRFAPHPTHAHVDKALKWIEMLKPRMAILTNLHIDLDYDDLSGRLPAGVVPAFDGMIIHSAFS